MMRLAYTRPADPCPVDLAHEYASLIARLALHGTFAPTDLDTIHELLRLRGAALVLAGLDQALDALAAEGRGPDFPAGRDADSYLMLVYGLQHLVKLSEPLPSILLAAA
ncbi:MAG: hypothetical protein ACRYFX_09765 [Janthinobacterium lividum]